MADVLTDTVREGEIADESADGAAPAPVPVPAAGTSWALGPRRTFAGTAAVAGLGVAGFIAAVAAARGREANVVLQPGEQVAFRVRPRHSLARYIASLGLWAFERRATHYTVTNQRLVVEEGLLHRVVRAVPLSALQHVHVRTGPWEGYVDVSAGGLRGRVNGEIGPLRSPVARAFAAALAGRAGTTVEES